MNLAADTGPIVDLHSRHGCEQLLALHDTTFSLQSRPRNSIRLYDLTSSKEVACMYDCLDRYELVGMAPLGGLNSPDEFVVGSVQGDFCVSCFQSGTPSLCFHKSEVHSSALSICDARVRGMMVQRYVCQHRSLYPLLRAERQHYIFTSHAGTPLCVWDTRAMSVPVYQEQRLPNGPSAAQVLAAADNPSYTGCQPQPCDTSFTRGGAIVGPLGVQHLGVPSYSTLDPQDPLRRHHSSSNHPAASSAAAAASLNITPTTSNDVSSSDVDASDARAPNRSMSSNTSSTTSGSSAGGGCPGALQGSRGLEEGDRGELCNMEGPSSSFCAAAPTYRWQPLPPAVRTCEHQGLWLESTPDLLLGRAENGMTWYWDLSITLGWASDSSRSGSWHMFDELGNWEWEGLGVIPAHLRTWPLPLGALPCETNLPALHCLATDPMMMVWHCGDTADGLEYATITALL